MSLPAVVVDRTLEEIAGSIRDHFDNGRRALGSAIEDQFAIGRDLLEARTYLRSDNEFGAWFDGQKFPFNRQRAWVLRAAAEREAEVRKEVATQVATGGDSNIKTALAAVRQGVHFTSNTPEWYTPPEIIERTVHLFGVIDLDPCSNTGKANVPSRKHFTESDDGLTHPWNGRVYMNPPYGDVIGLWVSKLANEVSSKRVKEAIALVPARTDTEWWQSLRDTSVCLVKGRLKFSGHENSAPFPSAVAYFGGRRAMFARYFGDLGDVWERVR